MSKNTETIAALERLIANLRDKDRGEWPEQDVVVAFSTTAYLSIRNGEVIAAKVLTPIDVRAEHAPMWVEHVDRDYTGDGLTISQTMYDHIGAQTWPNPQWEG